MRTKPTRSHQLFLIFGAVTGWFTIALQFYLMMVNRVAPVPETLIRFFSYFTILTNILVASYFTVLPLKRENGIFRFLSRSAVLTAITVYITVVGSVYQILLRHLWTPTGLQFISDELLHSFIPLYVVIYWSKFANKNELEWNQIPGWLIYPFFYLVFILFRGSLSGFYPYPFIDVGKLGYGNVILNSAGLLLALSLVSIFFILIAKSFRKKVNKF